MNTNHTLQSFEALYQWQRNHHFDLNPLNEGASETDLARLEALLNEPLPETFKNLYRAYNGERETAEGLPVFFGHGFMSIQEITRDIQEALQQVKPAQRSIPDPEKAKQLLDRITQFLMDKARGHTWEKMRFDVSPGSLGGPYIHAKADDSHYEILEIEEYAPVLQLVNELHKLEHGQYNWDELEFTVLSSGAYEVKRSDYDFTSEENFASWPEGFIRKKYFHPLWVPVFKDFGGNFIGIDLDPDVRGIKGQVIVFGRDESTMFVLGKDLDHCFGFFRAQIELHKNNPAALPLTSDSHLHDVLKKLVPQYLEL